MSSSIVSHSDSGQEQYNFYISGSIQCTIKVIWSLAVRPVHVRVSNMDSSSILNLSHSGYLLSLSQSENRILIADEGKLGM